MDCSEVSAELLDYHFAVGTQEQRDAVRAHLRSCMDCGQEYLDLKHDIDSGAAMAERPSEAARLRLQKEVAARFGEGNRPGLWQRLRSFLHEPTPRYRSLAAAAALGMVFGASALWLQKSNLQSAEPSAQLLQPARELSARGDTSAWTLTHAVDTARLQAVSITYY